MAMGNAKTSGAGSVAQDEPLRVRGWRMAGNVALLLALWLIGVMCIQVVDRRGYASLAPGRARPPPWWRRTLLCQFAGHRAAPAGRRCSDAGVCPALRLTAVARRGMERRWRRRPAPAPRQRRQLLAALRTADGYCREAFGPFAEQDSAPRSHAAPQIDILHSLENGTPSCGPSSG